MDRRDLLARTGVLLGTASLGGCLSRYEDVAGGPGETTTDETTTAETATEGTATESTTTANTTTEDGRDTTTDRQPSLVERSFELTDAGCGSPEGDASVSFREGDSSVVVTGTIPGANDCYVARLADAGYDPDSGAFVVTVESFKQEGADVCAQCIVQVDYEATFAFDGGLPATVNVVHAAMGESTTVTSVRSDGTTTQSN